MLKQKYEISELFVFPKQNSYDFALCSQIKYKPY